MDVGSSESGAEGRAAGRAGTRLGELTAEERARGLAVARSLRVAVFVVAYNAEGHIRETLRRIPADLRPLLARIYVIDDESSDRTVQVAEELRAEIDGLEVFTTPYNQGYGGNQKLGYAYAIREGFDVVVLLHGDGQYAPEVLPRMLAPFADEATAAVFGSRMLVKGAAKRGGMPFYKRVGNRVLTGLQNRMLGSRLSELHSGYRAYRVAALAELPFRYNTNDFHFDTEIIIQLLSAGQKIVEVPIPTYYGDEICHVNGLRYAKDCVGTVLRSRANRVHLVYHPKFDVEGRDHYVFKQAPTSLHQWVLRQGTHKASTVSNSVPEGAWAGQRVVELGAGHGEVSRSLHDHGAKVVALDLHKPDAEFPFEYVEADLDRPFAETHRRGHR